MFLVGFNKAFMCRPGAVKIYANFINDDLQDELFRRDVPTRITKTSYTAEMICYGINADSTLKRNVDVKKDFMWCF